MPAAKPRRHERGLVMPSGNRTIPRAPSPRRRVAREAAEVPEVPPNVAKAAGELTLLASRIRACTACERASARRTYGTGFPRAPVMIVGEHPSDEDLETEGSFTNEGAPLDKAFDALGIPLSWVYGAPAVRCGSTPATSTQVEACAIHLLIEIEAVEPCVIVACGSRAVEAIRALDGRCGLRVPEAIETGEPVKLRPGLWLIATEPMPDAVTQKDAKRRFWHDLKRVPEIVRGADRG